MALDPGLIGQSRFPFTSQKNEWFFKVFIRVMKVSVCEDLVKTEKISSRK